jgi:hypothetical protein
MPNLKHIALPGMSSLKNINCLRDLANLENIDMSDVTIAI